MGEHKRLRGEATTFSDGRELTIAPLALAFAAIAAYANSLSVPFIFDDWVTILQNPQLRQVWPIWSALSPPEYSGVGGRPVANLSFVLNHAVSGESVRGFHVGNLLIHFLAGLVLFGLVRRTLLRPEWRERFHGSAGMLALVVALFWMLHPVQTQSVTYISQRTESLMGLFYFLTLYAFARFTEASRSSAPRWLAVTVLSCFAGMATKEGMVTVPVMVLLYDYAFVAGSLGEAWRRRWKVYAALAASWVLLAVLMRGLPGRGVGFGTAMEPWTYLLIECRAIVTYLSLGLWPWPLVFDYGVDLGSPGTREVLCGALLVGLAVGTLIALRRAPAIGFLGAWFFITLSPTSSIVPIPLQPISENRVYVPLAAIAAGVVFAVHAACARRGVWALLGVSAAFAVLTFARNDDYRSEIAIWADTVAKRPFSSRARSNYAQALQSAGRLQEAKAEHEAALRLRPNYAEAHMNLAAVYGQLGDVERAIQHSRRAIELEPGLAHAHYNLGVALASKGDVAGAIAAYEAAVRVRGSAEAHGNLALLYLRVGRASDALTHAEASLRYKPGHLDGHFARACALLMLGRAREAVPVFQAIVRSSPTHADAHTYLGIALWNTGQTADAIAHLERALQINPNTTAAREHLERLRAPAAPAARP